MMKFYDLVENITYPATNEFWFGESTNGWIDIKCGKITTTSQVTVSNINIPTNSGTAVLVGGTVTVSNSNISATSIIILTKQTFVLPSGIVGVSSKSNGVSFTITSSNVLDTDTIGYMIINN
jgi:hypothetical protein